MWNVSGCMDALDDGTADPDSPDTGARRVCLQTGQVGEVRTGGQRVPMPKDIRTGVGKNARSSEANCCKYHMYTRPLLTLFQCFRKESYTLRLYVRQIRTPPWKGARLRGQLIMLHVVAC